MILVDTNIWVHHFRRDERELSALLASRRLMTHPYVVGELALGTLRDRAGTLAFLRALPSVPVADHATVMALVEHARLFGRGIGYVDAHLLASLQRLSGTTLWTRDKHLRNVATSFGRAAEFD